MFMCCRSRLGAATIEKLAMRKGVSSLTAAALAVFRQQPVPPGAVQTLRAVCGTLVTLFRASPAAEQRRAAEEWAAAAADIREVPDRSRPRHHCPLCCKCM